MTDELRFLLLADAYMYVVNIVLIVYMRCAHTGKHRFAMTAASPIDHSRTSSLDGLAAPCIEIVVPVVHFEAAVLMV